MLPTGIDELDARLILALAAAPRAGIMELARRLKVARDLFPITEHSRYFDHAGVAPISRVVADATQWWAEHMLTHGKVDYDALEARQESARGTAGRLMGVSADDVALIKNTTEGIAFV